MLNLIRRLVREEEGQGMVEYGLIIVLVSIAAIAALTFLGPEIAKVFTDIRLELGKR